MLYTGVFFLLFLMWMLPLVAILINIHSLHFFGILPHLFIFIFMVCGFVAEYQRILKKYHSYQQPGEAKAFIRNDTRRYIIKCGLLVSIGKYIVPLCNFQDIQFSLRWFFFMTNIYYGYLLVMLTIPTYILRMGWQCYHFMVWLRASVH